MRHGDDFDWFGGHSVKKEAQEVISRNHRAHGVSAPSPSYSTMITFWHCYNKNKTWSEHEWKTIHISFIKYMIELIFQVLNTIQWLILQKVGHIIILLELTRVNQDQNIFSLNVDLTSTFLLYRGWVHYHHQIVKSRPYFQIYLKTFVILLLIFKFIIVVDF